MKVFIFDMDGTFIDSMDYWNSCYNDWLLKKNKIVKDDLYEKLNSLKIDDGIEYIRSEYGIEDTKEEIEDQIRGLLEYHYKNEFKIDPSARIIFDKIKENGDKLVLATSTDRYLANVALERFDLKDIFDMEVVGDETPLHKDNPEYFYRIMDYFDVSAEDCYVFEDSLYAIKGAKKAGMNTVSVTFQSLKENLDEIVELTDYSCKNLTELRNKYLYGKIHQKEREEKEK